jgi:hypothetical protein
LKSAAILEIDKGKRVNVDYVDIQLAFYATVSLDTWLRMVSAFIFIFV